MNGLKFFKYIKADRFFLTYCPHIKNYKHKIRGKNGRGNPVKFTAAEQKQIKEGLKNLFADLKKQDCEIIIKKK